MSKATRRSVWLFAAGAVAVFSLWETTGHRPGNAGFAGVKPPLSGHERRETPAALVVAAPSSPQARIRPEQSPLETPPAGTWSMTLHGLGALAADNPDAALVRVAEFNEAEEQQAALKEVCSAIARRDPRLAFAAAWRFELGKLGGLAEVSALEDLAERWASRDPEGALAWMAREPHDKAGLRDYAVKGIAAAISRDSPESAALLIADNMSDNYPRFEATSALVGEPPRPDSPPSEKHDPLPMRRNDS